MSKTKETISPDNSIVIPKGEAALVSHGDDLQLFVPKKGGSKRMAKFLAAVGHIWATDHEFVDDILAYFEENTH